MARPQTIDFNQKRVPMAISLGHGAFMRVTILHGPVWYDDSTGRCSKPARHGQNKASVDTPAWGGTGCVS